MSLKRIEIRKNLIKKGFQEVRHGKHLKYNFYHKNRKTKIFTVMSHGTKYKEISSSRVGDMAKQCKVSKKIFLGLIGCSVSETKYIEEVSPELRR